MERIADGFRAAIPSTVVVVGIAVMIAAGLIGLAARPVLADSEPAPQSKSADPAKSAASPVSAVSPDAVAPPVITKDSLVYQGTVVDPAGQPVEGAKIYLVVPMAEPMRPLEPTWKPVAVTNAKGEFRFDTRELSDYQDLPPESIGAICATADGYGMAWTWASYFEATGAAVRRLRERAEKLPPQAREAALKRYESAGQPLKLKVDDEPVQGQIVNVDGQPVAGAKILLLQVYTGLDERLEEWHKKVGEERADFYSTRAALGKSMVGPQVRSLIPPVLTDAQGRFVLRGIGRDRIVELLIEGPGIQSDRIYARTESGKPIEIPNQWSRGTTMMDLFRPSQFIHVAGPSQAIVGVVVDKVSRKPIPGALILSQKRHGHSITGWGQDFVRTVADSEGRFKLAGMPIGDDNRIGAIPPTDLAYVSTSKLVKTTVSAEPLTVDFELQPGVWISGRVTDKQTGEGLAGNFQRFTFRDNTAGDRHHVDERQLLVADSHGRFRLVVAPGHGILGFMAERHEKYPRGAGAEAITDGTSLSPTRPYFETNPYYCQPSSFHVLKEINPSLDEKEIQLDLVLDAGNNLRGRVVDASGKPALTAAFTGRMKEFTAWDQLEPGGEFEILGYDPAVPRTLVFFDRVQSLAARVLLSGPPPNPFVVKLEPAGKATGRIVDENNDPIPNLELRKWTLRTADPAQAIPQHHEPLPLVPTDIRRNRFDLFTDQHGRFEFQGLIPDQEYRVEAIARADKGLPRIRFLGPLDVVIKVKAGEVVDLGDVRIADSKAFLEKFQQSVKANVPRDK